METLSLLNFCWKQKLLGTELLTSDGERMDVLDCGLYNRHDGPDYFNAKIRINGLLFVGNVMVLYYAHHWRYYGYDCNPHYQNVILVLARFADEDIYLMNGAKIPVCQASIPSDIEKNCNILLRPKGQLECKTHLMEYTTTLIRHAWLAAMQTELIENKSEHVRSLYEKTQQSWERTALVTLFRGFGFGVNDDTMEKIALSIPAEAIHRHCDDVFQIEAMVFGQAGLLELGYIPREFQKEALMEGYFAKLRNEYLYLAHKYDMKRPGISWVSYGRGVQKHPHTYLSMIVNLIYERRLLLSRIVESKTEDDFCNLLDVKCTPYWKTHYIFGALMGKTEKHLSHDRKSHILSSAIVPFLFAYGRFKGDKYCDRAFDVLEQMKPFATKESKVFSKYGLTSSSAGDSIAMVHLQNEYCRKANCLKCRFGYEFVKKHPVS